MQNSLASICRTPGTNSFTFPLYSAGCFLCTGFPSRYTVSNACLPLTSVPIPRSTSLQSSSWQLLAQSSSRFFSCSRPTSEESGLEDMSRVRRDSGPAERPVRDVSALWDTWSSVRDVRYESGRLELLIVLLGFSIVVLSTFAAVLGWVPLIMSVFALACSLLPLLLISVVLLLLLLLGVPSEVSRLDWMERIVRLWRLEIPCVVLIHQWEDRVVRKFHDIMYSICAWTLAAARFTFNSVILFFPSQSSFSDVKESRFSISLSNKGLAVSINRPLWIWSSTKWFFHRQTFS